MGMSEILAGISILLVFITVSINIVYPRINNYLHTRPPSKKRPNDRKKYKNEVKGYIIFKTIPLFFFLLLLFYLCLPTTINYLINGKLEIWNFDLTITLFIFIEVSILILLSINTFLLFKIIHYNKSIDI